MAGIALSASKFLTIIPSQSADQLVSAPLKNATKILVTVIRGYFASQMVNDMDLLFCYAKQYLYHAIHFRRKSFSRKKECS